MISIIACILAGAGMTMKMGEGLYMGLILVWAGPFILLLWYERDTHILNEALIALGLLRIN